MNSQAILSEIWVYPVKSCAGVSLRQSLLTEAGLEWDRCWMVVDAQGVAAQAGIRRGDVVLGLNNAEVQSLEQFNKQLAATPNGKTVAVLVQRGDNTLYVPIKVGDGK